MQRDSTPAIVFGLVLLLCAAFGAFIVSLAPSGLPWREDEACRAAGGLLLRGADHQLYCINRSALVAGS